MRSSQLLIFGLFCAVIGAPANSWAQQVEAISAYPNEDYFWVNTEQQSWDRINDFAREAGDRFTAEQKRLDAERDRKLGAARGDEAQKKVHDWYDVAFRELERRRSKAYLEKEEAQRLMREFYAERRRRAGSSNPDVREAERREHERRQLEGKQDETSNLRLNRILDEHFEVRDMPEFKSAPEVKEPFARLERQMAAQASKRDKILKALSKELTFHLLTKDQWKNNPALLKGEMELHQKTSRALREMLRQADAEAMETLEQYRQATDSVLRKRYGDGGE